MFRAVALSAIVAAASADVLEWQGLATSFDEPSLFSGTTVTGSTAPGYTAFGATGARTVAGAPASSTPYKLGQRIELRGNARLFLGDGRPGSRTTLQLTPGQRSNVALENVATFAPTELAAATAGGSMIDFGCHLNYQTTDGGISRYAPNSTDRVKFAVAGGASAFTVNVPVWSAARSLIGSNNAAIQDTCVAPAGGPVSLNYASGACGTSMWFGGAAQPTSYAYTATTCPPDSIITAADGTQVEVYTSGGRAGTAFSNGANVSNSLDISSDGSFSYGGNSYNADGSAASEETDSSMMIVIVIAAAAIIIIIIVAVVVIKVKNDKANGAPQHGTVSFENPMYDETGDNAENAADGMYDEPNMVQDTGGYMDVPAGNGGEGGGGSGYMDVAPNSGGAESSGYMDVSPETDAFGEDYGEDNEDI
jgi:hypothetical protein